MRSEKKLLMRALLRRCEQHPAFFVANYRGMKAQSAVKFRQAMRQSGAEFEVVRKRLLLKALEETGTTVDKSLLEGHLGVVFACEDPLVAIKRAYEFVGEHALPLHFVGSRFEGKFLTALDTETLSKLPSLPEMRAQLLALLVAPVTGILGTFNALLAAVPQCLDQKIQRDTDAN